MAKNYRQRVADYWKWFDENQEKLADYIDNIQNYDADAMVGFFSKGLSIAMENGAFNLGGARELNLTPEGDQLTLFLTTYLCKSIPDKYKDTWTYTPWKSAAPGMSLSLGDVSLSADDILVSVEEDNGKFGIEFYNKTLNEIDENQAYNIYYIIMDLSLGENIAMGFINWVDKADEPKDGMIKLSELRQYMNDNTENGIADDYNPIRSYFGYGGDPVPNEKPRYDIIAGFSSMLPVLRSYYNDETEAYDYLASNGAKAVFIAFPRTSEDHNIDLELRTTIAERLEEEVLGIEEGKEIGVLVGQAVGAERCYIDLLLYDEEEFMSKACAVLKDFDIEAKIYDFVSGAEAREFEC